MDFAASDLTIVFESAQIGLFQKMDRASILRSAGAVTEANRITERVVADLYRLAVDLNDRHHTRVEALLEVKERAAIAARSRPTLTRMLSGDSRRTHPAAGAHSAPVASPQPHPASS